MVPQTSPFDVDRGKSLSGLVEACRGAKATRRCMGRCTVKFQVTRWQRRLSPDWMTRWVLTNSTCSFVTSRTFPSRHNPATLKHCVRRQVSTKTLIPCSVILPVGRLQSCNRTVEQCCHPISKMQTQRSTACARNRRSCSDATRRPQGIM